MVHARALSICALLLPFSFNAALHAQNSYLLEVSQPGVDPYIELNADTPIQLFAEDGWHTLAAPPQLPVWLFGSNYTLPEHAQVSINRNGHVRFGNDYVYAELSLARTPMETIDASSRISYQHFHGPGGGILVIQFKNLRLLNGINGNYMNAQLWYYGTTGTIEMHYGPRSESNANGFAGDRGPHVGVYHTPTDLSGCLDRVWLSGSPDGPQVSYAASYDFPAMTGLPYEGTVFRFVPLFTLPAGINEQAASPFRMLSNVVHNELSIDVQDPNGTSVDLFDAAGLALRTQRLRSGINHLMVDDLAPGMYLLRGTGSSAGPGLRFAKE